jgi:hypothetical protein
MTPFSGALKFSLFLIEAPSKSITRRGGSGSKNAFTFESVGTDTLSNIELFPFATSRSIKTDTRSRDAIVFGPFSKGEGFVSASTGMGWEMYAAIIAAVAHLSTSLIQRPKLLG